MAIPPPLDHPQARLVAGPVGRQISDPFVLGLRGGLHASMVHDLPFYLALHPGAQRAHGRHTAFAAASR
jgi:hypothetical protein